MSFLSVEELTYRNLTDIDMEFKENNIYFISGSNKCGKTTLSRILAGLIEVEDAVYYNNKDISTMSSNSLSNKIKCLSSDDRLRSDLDISNYLDKEIEKSSTDNIRSDLKKLISKFGIDPKKNIKDLTIQEEIKVLLVSKLISKPNVLVLDDVFIYFEVEEAKKILSELSKISGLIVILFSSNLELSVMSNYMYIIDNGTIKISGEPFEVLKNDSYLNKLGLELPFMVDLSLKLKYYDLVDNIELDMDRMIDLLWK